MLIYQQKAPKPHKIHTTQQPTNQPTNQPNPTNRPIKTPKQAPQKKNSCLSF